MDSFKPRFATLNDIFAESTGRFAERPLFGVKRGGAWQCMTYAEFREETDRICAGLATLGVDKGDRVDQPARVGHRRVCGLRSRRAVVPMYEAQREDNWRYILGDSGAKVAFVANDRIRARIAAFHDEVPALTHVVVFDTGSDSPEDALALAGLGRDTPPVGLTPTKPEDMAGFVYTSGTTGNPKRVMLSHGNLAGNVSAIIDVFPLEDDARSLSFL